MFKFIVLNKIHQNKFFILIFILILIPLHFALSSCDDTVSIKDIDDKPMPASNVKFSEDIYPVLNAKCNRAGCHNDESRAGDVSLTTWSNVTDPRLIVKGDTTTSLLVWCIDKVPGAKWMPPNNYPQLTREQIRGIKTWIQEGAKNN